MCDIKWGTKPFFWGPLTSDLEGKLSWKYVNALWCQRCRVSMLKDTIPKNSSRPFKATLYSIQPSACARRHKQIHVASSRHPGRNQGHAVRCWYSDAVTLSSTMRTGGFELGSNAMTSSTLKWLDRIQVPLLRIYLPELEEMYWLTLAMRCIRFKRLGSKLWLWSPYCSMPISQPCQHFAKIFPETKRAIILF
jgi:hypothetical protein